ncbi:MAG: 4-hydroxybenzoate octaprenyltransferase [Verrucomicrobia bacterium Tous-C9LFEB]|nr:MAG: 4-hydroxybenzoate octaprenyltransferase [Verrucomicrobia bacterium Tous-C9LFEB]
MNTPQTSPNPSACPCCFNLQGLFNALEFIKFSHTIFALPFALISMIVAAHGLPTLRTVLLILLCMVAARTAAMAFNRWADWEFDKTNPRTARRSTLVTRATACALYSLATAVFVVSSILINPLCGWLSPLAVLLILGYSLTKRFTAYTHAFLGLALAAAPMGAWAAVTGDLLTPVPWSLAAAVWFWVFGFDLIYATQDVEHDRRSGLHSFPARYGVKATLAMATLLHILAWIALAVFGWLAAMSVPYWISLAIVAGALVYEHRLSRTGKLDQINVAFFQMNALVGVALFIGTALDVWMSY